jgi:hypothetical protein
MQVLHHHALNHALHHVLYAPFTMYIAPYVLCTMQVVIDWFAEAIEAEFPGHVIL